MVPSQVTGCSYVCNPADYASQKYPNQSRHWGRIQSAVWLKKKKKKFKEMKLKRNKGEEFPKRETNENHHVTKRV